MRQTEKRYVRAVSEWRAEDNYQVRGYASTFEPYVLYEDGIYTIYEQVDRNAFDEADMSDVVLRIDHEGKVYCRTSAHTLIIGVDDHGLYFLADLSKTAAARELYDEIRAGNYPKASYCYRLAEDGVVFDEATRTRHVTKIIKVFDVSPCAFVQNPTTDVQARGQLITGESDGAVEAERLKRAQAWKRLNIAMRLAKLKSETINKETTL